MERSSRLRRSFLFGLYCACMLWLLFGRWPNPRAIPFGEYLSTHLNVVPFRTIRLFGRRLVPPPVPSLFVIARSKATWQSVSLSTKGNTDSHASVRTGSE